MYPGLVPPQSLPWHLMPDLPQPRLTRLINYLQGRNDSPAMSGLLFLLPSTLEVRT